MLNKLKIIVLSRFRKPKNEIWVEQRRKICKHCQYNSINAPQQSFKNKMLKYLSDFYTFITRAENEDLGQCECSCDIYYKTQEETEECYAKEKYGDDKWKSIYIPNKK